MDRSDIRRWIKVLGLAGVVLAAVPLAGMGMGRAAAAEGTANACGCYQDPTGSCLCGKKSRCGCPGECEPKGCEEKREKELRKEIDAETKKAQAGQRRAQPSDGNGRAHAPAEEAAEERPAAREHQAKAKHMTPGQKKELLRLLDLYAAEHADHAGRSIDQVRGELTTGTDVAGR